MKLRSLSRRWAARGGVAAIAVVTLAGGMQAAATAAVHRSAAPRSGDPYSPAAGHAYRHGAVPTRPAAARMRAWAVQHPAAAAGIMAPRAAAATTGPQLLYGGGNPGTGVGVTTGAPKVYLVFYGNQWGATGTSNGDMTFANDPSGEAPYLQEFLKGLGTGGERWSGVMTQYCDGVNAGASSCPPGSAFVGYPAGGVLAGVWADESAASPAQATAHQLGVEAVAAAGHFGNNDAAANRDAQYVIVSPAGTNPDDWTNPATGFCAWHDWNGDTSLDGGGAVSSGVGDVAFTNLPYLTDLGTSCGQNFVNPGTSPGGPGTLDGLSIVEGHEYAETITDQEPGTLTDLPYGWYDTSFGEDGDICAWFSPGTPGGSADLGVTTGTYAVQTTWANDANSSTPSGCEAGHDILGSSGAGAVTVTGPGNQTTVLGDPVTLHTTASESGKTSFTYSATGLPSGASYDPSTGTISGTPNTAGVYHVTVAADDGAGGSGQATFTWTASQQVLGNPGFESGVLTPWTASSGVLNASSAGTPAHSGNWLARLDGRSGKHTDTLAQTHTIAGSDTSASFSFWLDVVSNDPTNKAYDTLKVEVLSSSGKVLKTLATYSNKTATGYAQHSFSMTSYIGKKITIKFIGAETLTKHNTSFFVDDNALLVH
jgi:serine protease